MVQYMGGTWEDCKGLPGHGHHVVARTACVKGGLEVDLKREAPCVNMRVEDHEKTLSNGLRGKLGEFYRGFQLDLVERGDAAAAFYVDVASIRKDYGARYDEGIIQAERQLLKLVEERKIEAEAAVRRELEERQRKYEEKLLREKLSLEKEKAASEGARERLEQVEAELKRRETAELREREAELRRRAESTAELKREEARFSRELSAELARRAEVEVARVQAELRERVEAALREEARLRLRNEEASRLDETYRLGVRYFM